MEDNISETTKQISWDILIPRYAEIVPLFGSPEYTTKFDPITPEQGVAYKAHMSCD